MASRGKSGSKFSWQSSILNVPLYSASSGTQGVEGSLEPSSLPLYVEHGTCVEAPSRQKSQASDDFVARHLVVVHGIGEHSGRYKRMLEEASFTSCFVGVTLFDLRGHGRSGGIRGHVDHRDDFGADLSHVLASVVRRGEHLPGVYGDRPMEIVLLGHSMGGLIVLDWLRSQRAGFFSSQKRVRLAGSILSAPFLGLNLRVPTWKLNLGRVLDVVAPRVLLANEINPNDLSHDPEVVDAYIRDRLVHNRCSPRLFWSLEEMRGQVGRWKGPLPCPLLFLLPGQDRLVSTSETQRWLAELPVDQRERVVLQEYPDFFHEVLNELDRHVVYQDVARWLSQI